MKRIESIDIFRALTMLMMLWVNDFAGMAGIPHWLCHAGATEDMMGFSDLVFPSFLFCVGLSLPYAIEGRFRKGQSLLEVLSHIVARSFALIVMGLFSMNCSGIEGGINHQVFCILMVAAYFLIWNVYPDAQGTKKTLYRILKITGVLILVGLAVYRYSFGHPLQPKWWGILGLIGWANLICSLGYLLCRNHPGRNAVLWLFIIALMIALNSGVKWLGFYPGGWTHPALVCSGVLVSVLMSRFADDRKPSYFVGILLCGALLMKSAEVLCHNFWICSKIGATPTWAFGALSCYLPILAALYLVCDVYKKNSWAKPIAPAGKATLTCYLIPTVWYSVQQLIGISYPEFLRTGIPGLCKSMVLAFIFIFITWMLSKIHIKLKI